jgi:hypothetical protein
MAPFLRLRQICLVASDLTIECARIKSIFGLEECYRDGNVGKYGLQNVLFPIGSNFIEIVSPIRPGTAAGRFLERHAGRYGYMVIMDCDDPEQRQRRAESLGVRAANVIRHAGYLGVQLHPKDTGAAILEFNSTDGGVDPMAAYAPAGPNWQGAIRQDVTRRLAAAEIECPDPGKLAARWAEIVERPAQICGNNRYRIVLDAGAIEFLPAAENVPVLAGVALEVADVATVIAKAKAQGCETGDATVSVCGVRFRLSASAVQ